MLMEVTDSFSVDPAYVISVDAAPAIERERDLPRISDRVLLRYGVRAGSGGEAMMTAIIDCPTYEAARELARELTARVNAALEARTA